MNQVSHSLLEHRILELGFTFVTVLLCKLYALSLPSLCESRFFIFISLCAFCRLLYEMGIGYLLAIVFVHVLMWVLRILSDFIFILDSSNHIIAGISYRVDIFNYWLSMRIYLLYVSHVFELCRSIKSTTNLLGIFCLSYLNSWLLQLLYFYLLQLQGSSSPFGRNLSTKSLHHKFLSSPLPKPFLHLNHRPKYFLNQPNSASLSPRLCRGLISAQAQNQGWDLGRFLKTFYFFNGLPSPAKVRWSFHFRFALA